MAQGIVYAVADGIARIELDTSSANALSFEARSALCAALDKARTDSMVEAVVLSGSGPRFPSGLDLAERDHGRTDPSLSELCMQIEACPKPVIAALHGTVYGSGMEVALSAHFRVCAAGTRASLPDVRMGLTPSAGATQRLPRLAGVSLALDMLLSGSVLLLDAGAGRVLVDEVSDGDLLPAALDFGRRLVAEGIGPRPVSSMQAALRDYTKGQSAIDRWQEILADRPEEGAEHRILRLVDAARLLPFEAGLAMEEDAFEACLASEESGALRHAVMAERVARQTADTAEMKRMSRVAVLGAGPLALQIVLAGLNVGLTVSWGAREPEDLRSSVEQLRDVIEAGLKSGGLSKSQAAARLEGLIVGAREKMVEDAEIVLLADPAESDTPLPTNTTCAGVAPGRVARIGLRFVPPVYASRLMEIVQGPSCSPDDLTRAQALAAALNKVPVVVRSHGLSAAGRLTAALHRAADALVDLGADPYAIDDALDAWGWHRPPFRLRDKQGIAELAVAPRAQGAQNWSAQVLEMGRRGARSGAGVYDWRDGRPRPSEKIRARVDALRPAKVIAPEVICHRIVAALANEGCRMLRGGMVQRASDIDAVALLALDFPRHRGGPMKAASQIGMLKALKVLERTGHVDEAFWSPEPVWRELVKNGRSFFS